LTEVEGNDNYTKQDFRDYSLHDTRAIMSTHSLPKFVLDCSTLFFMQIFNTLTLQVASNLHLGSVLKNGTIY